MRISMLFTVFVLLLGFTSCTEQSKDEKLLEDFTTQEEYKVPSVLIGATLGDIPIPDHTLVTYRGASSIQFELPENVFVFSKGLDGKLYQTDNMCYDCTCSQAGSGCNVFYVQGSFACSECSGSCTGKRVSCDEGPQERVINESDFMFVDFNQGVRFIAKKNDAERLGQAKAFFFDIPEVKAELEKLNQKYYNTSTVTEEQVLAQNAKIVGVNIFGILIGYPVPQASALNTTFAGVSCDCQSGSSGCDREWSVGAGYWCEGGDCTTCRMEVEDDPKE